MSKYSLTDEGRFSARQAEADRFKEAIAQERRKRGIRPDENKYIPLNKEKKE